MNFVCPSCRTANRCPESAAGLTIICRRCKTQATVPTPPGGVKTLPWTRSPGWLAVIFVELLALAGVVTAIVALAGARPPEELALADDQAGGPVPLAVAGQAFGLEWSSDIETPGGYFRVVGSNVELLHGHEPPRLLTAQPGDDDPWPEELLHTNDLPPPRAVRLALDVDLPTSARFQGEKILLRARIDLEHPHRPEPGARVRIRRRSATHEQTLVLATEDQRSALERHARFKNLLRAAVFASAMVLVTVGVAACVLRQKSIKVMCPKCGRAMIATFYHGRGELSTTPCPHSGARASSDLYLYLEPDEPFEEDDSP